MTRIHSIVFLVGAVAFIGCARPIEWTDLPENPHWSGAPSEYSLAILTGSTPFDIEDAIARQEPPVLTASDIDGLAAAYVADPFLFPHKDRWYMFYELLQASPRRGRIAWAESEDGRNWEHKGLALVEPFHMSFPHVFAWEDEIYMVLESNEVGEIRLYKADSFPGEWTLESVLVEGVFVDNTILRYDDRWWLFTSPLHSRDLHLFFSDHLTHGWEEHPQSPVVRNDIRRARPAGRVIEYDDRLWRFGMDCGPRYGYAVRLLEIVTLTPTEYEQREAENSPLIEAGMFPWAGLGMHHYDPQPYKDGDEAWLVVVDGNTRVPPEIRLEAQFEDGSMLLGATRRPPRIPAGEKVLLRLYWKNLPEIHEDRALVFVHVKQGNLMVTQADHGLEERPEQYDLFIEIPADTPPGELDVWIGLHHPGTGRLAARSPYEQQRNAVRLPIPIEVVQ